MTDFLTAYKAATLGKDDQHVDYDSVRPSLLSSDVSTHERGTTEYLEDWVNANRPRCWVCVEEHAPFQVWIDHGHGLIALFDTSNGELSWGKDSCALYGTVIANDVDYYGYSSYLSFIVPALKERKTFCEQVVSYVKSLRSKLVQSFKRKTAYV